MKRDFSRPKRFACQLPRALFSTFHPLNRFLWRNAARIPHLPNESVIILICLLARHVFVIRRGVRMLRNYDGKTMFKAALDGRIDAIISHESRNRNFFCLFFSQIFMQAAFFKAAVDGFGEDFFTRLRYEKSGVGI